MNILISSAGRRVSLVREFQIELKKKFSEGSVFTTDMKPELSAACNISDKYFQVPAVTSKNYIDYILDICLKNEVKIVIPTIDTELLILSKNKELFKKKNINLIISEVNFIEICRDKRLTHKFFDDYMIRRAKELDRDDLKFPLFIKPFDGSCSKDIFVIQNMGQLTDYHLQNDNFMFLEYLDPKNHTEFTVDTYYDKNSNLKAVIPRERIEIRSGEVNKGITRRNELVPFIENKLSHLPGAVGCITMQFFQNNINKKFYGIETNPRFGGGYPLSYLAGANFPKMLIEEYIANKKIDYYDGWEENLLMLRYDDEVLVRNAEI